MVTRIFRTLSVILLTATTWAVSIDEATAQCAGNCGLNAGTCWCDEACFTFLDCCPDVCNFCNLAGCGATAPANDLCADAIPLTCGVSVAESTINATTTGAPGAACGTSAALNGAGGVWYSFVGTGASVTLSTCTGTDYDSQIAVFTGTCGALTCVAGNDDACGVQTTVTFTSTLGTSYLVYVTGFGGNTGNFTMSNNLAAVTPTVTAGGPTSFCPGGSVTLTSSFQSTYSWSPSGGSAQAATVSTAGGYTVTGTINGCSATSAATAVSVFTAPTATVSGGGVVCNGVGVTVSVALTGTAPWNIVLNGTPFNGIATSPFTTTVTAAATYTVSSVTDANGCTGTSSGSAVVTTGSTPVAAFTSTTAGLTANFTDASTNSPTSWAWTFGDGNNSALQNPSHTYATGGTYNVCLTATNGCGSNQVCQNVTVVGAVDCIHPTAFGTATAPTTPTTVTISTCNFAGEYAVINSVVAGETYTFTSSVATDWLVLTDGASSTPVLASGTTPITWTATFSGTVRLHISTSNACGTQNTCRTTTVTCNSCTLPTDCIHPTAFGTATAPTTPTTVTISTCNFAGEYAVINSVVAGQTYTFASSVATDWLVLTDGASSTPVLASGTTPITWTATFSGTVRLHISTSNACGTQNTCRTTTVTCNTCVAPPAPVNDLCGNAIPLTCGVAVNGTTVNATTTGALATCTTSLNTAGGVWYSFFGTGAPVTFNTCTGTTYDSKIGVFQGPCTALTCIAGNDDATGCGSGLQSSVTANTTAGTQYFVYVTGFGTATGAFTLSNTMTPIGPTITAGGPTTFCQGGSVTLSANTSVSYTWAPTGGTGQTNSVTTSGSYTVTTVDVNNCQATSLPTVVTVNPAPTATLTGGATICSPLTTDLTITLTGTGPWTVTLNDGTSNSTLNIASSPFTQTVSTAGTYTITSVTDATTCTGTGTGTAVVVVNSAPVAGFTATTNNLDATFTDASTGGPTTYAWDFGDSGTDNIANPTHTYAAAGTYTVCLTVTNSCGTDQDCQPVTVTANTIPNDLCGGAIDITCGQSITGTTVGADAADAPATCTTTLNTSPGIWYRFVGTGESTTVSTCTGTAYDSKLGVFQGPCTSLTCVAGNDDACGLQSSVTFTSVLGQEYLIYVTGFGTATGAFTLTVTCTPAPVNDLCGGALPLTCATPVTGTTVGADAVDAPATCTTALNTSPGIWYTFFGTGAPVTLNTCTGTTYDSKLGVFEGPCTALTCVGGNDDACGLQSSVTAATTAGTQYYVYVTGFGGATGAFTLSNDIAPTVPTVTASGPVAICQGGSVTLTSSTANSYDWSPSGGSAQSETVTTAGSYTVTVEDLNNCSATSSATVVTVNTAPSATISGGGEVCNGQGVNITGVLTGTGPWNVVLNTPAGPFPINGVTSSPITQNVTAPGTYTVTSVTDATSCPGTTSGSAVVTVGNGPTSAFTSAPTDLTVVFTDASTGSPTSWAWDFGDGNTSTQQSPTHTYATAGAYNVCLTATNNCGTNQICQSVTVTSASCTAAAGTITSSATACLVNGTATLTGTPGGNAVVPSGFATGYALTQGGIIIQISGTPTFTVTATGTYTLHTLVYNPADIDPTTVPLPVPASVVNGLLIQGGGTFCGSLDLVGATVTVNSGPTADISGGGAICNGAGVDLTGVLTGTGPWDVVINTPGGPFPINGITSSPYTQNVTVPGTYTLVSVSDASGCSGTVSGSATVTTGGNAPVAGFTASANLLAVTFTDASTGSPTSWAWDFGDGNTSTQQSPTHTYATAGTYNVCLTVTNSCGTDQFCQTVTVSSNACPVSAGTLNASAAPACLVPGQTVTLNASPSGNSIVPSGFQTLYLLVQGGIIQQTNTTPSFAVNTNGIYTIHTFVYDPNTFSTATIQNGVTTAVSVNSQLLQGGGAICASLALSGVNFNVVTPVVPTVSPAGPLDICPGTAVLLTSSTASQYLWLPTQGTASFTYASDPGSYTVTTVDANGCVSNSAPVVVTNLPVTTGIITASGNTLSVDQVTTGYQWFHNGDPVPGATGQSYDAVESGYYWVVYTDPNGCETSSDTIEFSYIGIEEVGFDYISVYPNPSGGQFTVAVGEAKEELTFIVTELTGRVLFRHTIAQMGDIRQEISLDVASGTYLLQVLNNDGRGTSHLIQVMR